MQMKRKCIIVTGILVVMLAATGCGSGQPTGNEDRVIPVIPMKEEENAGAQNQSDEAERGIPEAKDSDNAVSSANGSDAAGSNDNAAPENNCNDTMEIIGGKVKSIAQDSFVISRVIVDENGMILVMPGEGGPDEQLTTIHCTDSTVFEHWTIQSGGSGIEKKEAAFSDVKEGSGLEAEGYFEGEEFVAGKVIIEVYQ